MYFSTISEVLKAEEEICIHKKTIVDCINAWI